MPTINTAGREIIAKVVYYGPGLGGKTTNLEKLYEQLDPAKRGRFVSLANTEDRTLFFDMLPVNAGMISGLQLRFHLYTVPGQVYYNASRKLVLQGADGVVFVADSHPARLEANVEAMQNLYDNMRAIGQDLGTTPFVIAYNKRDMPGALPLDLLEQTLNPSQVPAYEQQALHNVGVVEVLGEILRLVEANLRRR